MSINFKVKSSYAQVPEGHHWLGHASINTTNRYVSIDLEMKREAINKAAIDSVPAPTTTWRSDASILTWLESLSELALLM